MEPPLIAVVHLGHEKENDMRSAITFGLALLMAGPAAAQEAGAPVIAWGMFVNTIIDFVIIAFVLFLIVRQINKMKRAEEAKTKDCPFCKSEISIDATRCAHCTSEVS